MTVVVERDTLSALVEVGFDEVVAEFSGGVVLVDEGLEVGEAGVLGL